MNYNTGEESEVLLEDLKTDRNYTFRELGPALKDAGHEQAAEILEIQLRSDSEGDRDVSDLQHPGVPVDCLFGKPRGTEAADSDSDRLNSTISNFGPGKFGDQSINQTVGSRIAFPNGLRQPSASYSGEPGDGEVPSRSLETTCRRWALEANTRVFAIKDATHRGILREEEAKQIFAEAVMEESKDPEERSEEVYI